MKSDNVIVFILFFLLVGCGRNEKLNRTVNEAETEITPLFSVLAPNETGLDFVNRIKEGPGVNGILYEYLYNGGGIAVGDFNNDGLQDLYFISTLHSNKLYINKGDFKFEDQTDASGLKGKVGFPTGVTTVDINSDGLLDIYISKSGKYPDPEYRRNELYINKGPNENGIPVFSEEATRYGLDLAHYSTQATFFDYDRDGDLDLFLLNHNIDPGKTESEIDTLLQQKSEYSANKLFKNDNGWYVDVSDQSGIVNNSIGYGLGVAVGDLNNDQWPDIVIGMDYSEKDHIYINQKDGTFAEVATTVTNHISNFSMGNDIGDINNDGLMDIISVDMVSNNNYDLKTNMSGMNPRRFQDMVDRGLHYQYMFNTLQLNNGNMMGKGKLPSFSDIAQFSGVSNTNWSWAPLLFDMDNDGFQDLFVSNGVLRSFRNNDFIIFKRERVAQLYKDLEKYTNKDSLIAAYYTHLLAVMPEKKEVNLLYTNNGDLTFSEMNGHWKLNLPTATNGAIYADLDNDGDLDIVGNNINDPAIVYKNNTRELTPTSNFLKIKLNGSAANLNGIGAKVIVESDGKEQTKEHYVSRGFQSSVGHILHFGLAKTELIDKVTVQWPDGKAQTLNKVKPNQQLVLNYNDSDPLILNEIPSQKLLFKTVEPKMEFPFTHTENSYDDFQRESLLPHKFSQNGPALAAGDVNNDGLDDFYVGGAKDQAAMLFIQNTDGSFIPSNQSIWAEDKRYEDVSAVFFDADNDGDLDLYVASGGNEATAGDTYYKNRFYENLGDGKFKKLENTIPDFLDSESCILTADFDNDGDMDLFIGSKLVPGQYPLPASSRLLRNDSANGIIKFTDITQEVAPFLTDLGMVSSARWVDLDNNGFLDLIVVGEWMPIKIFKNTNGKFRDITSETGLEGYTGWWFSVASADFDNDGDQDFLVGNLGLNYKYKASMEEPFEVYAKDFDNNGSLDIVLSYHEEGKEFPLRGRECTSNQMPFIKKKFPKYEDFGVADLSQVYGEEELKNALHYKATTFATVYVENLGNMKFKVHNLEGIPQFSSVNNILVDDFDDDGNVDALLSGNLYQSEIETTRNDASYGVLLLGNGKGKFTSLFPYESGLFVKGDVKNAEILKTDKEDTKRILFAKNNDSLQFVEVKGSQKNLMP